MTAASAHIFPLDVSRSTRERAGVCCPESNSKKEAPLKEASSRKCNDSKELQVERSTPLLSSVYDDYFWKSQIQIESYLITS